MRCAFEVDVRAGSNPAPASPCSWYQQQGL